MNVLEKILEEIEERIKKLKEADNMCRVNAEHNRNFESVKYFQSLIFSTERAESIIGDIIRSHMDEANDTNVPSNGGWILCKDNMPTKDMDGKSVWITYGSLENLSVVFAYCKWVLSQDENGNDDSHSEFYID